METINDKAVEDAKRVGTHYTVATAGEGVTLEDSQRIYNDWALLYDETLEVLDRRSHVYLADNVADCFKKDKIADVKILDVGAGTGLVGQELNRHGFVHIDALEPNEVMMSKARERSVYENYFIDYLNEGPSSFKPDTYDVVTGCGIFAESAHVPCEALNEMIRITKPGGYIVLAARLSVLERDGEASRLERVMDQLENEHKWTKMTRVVSSMYNAATKQPGVFWKYQVTK